MGWVFFIVSLLATPLWGWTFSALWDWFVTPVFGGPAISLWQAVGIQCLISLARYKLGQRKFSDEEYASACVETIFAPLIYLGAGRLLAGAMGVA